jgi:hypothetical protein
MTHYLTNGIISSKIDSGVKDNMLSRLTISLNKICKDQGMVTDEHDVIAMQVERKELKRLIESSQEMVLRNQRLAKLKENIQFVKGTKQRVENK